MIYADDTTLLEIVDDPAVSAGRLNSDLNKIAVWADKWLVTINPVKTRTAVFSLKRILDIMLRAEVIIYLKITPKYVRSNVLAQ